MGFFKGGTKIIAAAALIGIWSFPSFAIDLDQARNQGLVGERVDGLVGAVSASATPEVRALVEAVNKARMAEYASIAQKNGTAVEAVQAVAGERQIQRAKDNKWFVLDASGRWTK